MLQALAIAYSRALAGVNSPLITVETDLSNGLPAFAIVGLPEAAVRESKDRVRSALLNSQFEFPARRITVNLAPADLPKESGRFDLAIAIGILAASKQLPLINLNQYELIGEVALSGELRPVRGVLPMALACYQAGRQLILPEANAREAALVQGLVVLPARHILEVCAHLNQHKALTPEAPPLLNEISPTQDIQEVIGQTQAKRALEIAAAGGHHLLMVGPPGTGKTMLAHCLPSILPPMTLTESLEAAAMASISYHGFQLKQWQLRPFRAPHHSASSVALVGGGNPPRPGEISLAHCGVLFLDELPEFSRHVLESLREPLESGIITISRATRQADFPAKFQLIAAMNPCPCGYLTDKEYPCRCTPNQIQHYHQKISGPLLDRIDLHIHVPRHNLANFMQPVPTENKSSAHIRQQVSLARQRQVQRAGICNAQLTNAELKRDCQLVQPTKLLLEQVTQKLKLSARAYHRLLKVALTIADLAESDQIHPSHVSEALLFRQSESHPC